MFESINAIHDLLNRTTNTKIKSFVYCVNCSKLHELSDLKWLHNNHGAEYGVCPDCQDDDEKNYIEIEIPEQTVIRYIDKTMRYKTAYERLLKQTRDLINLELRIYKAKLRPGAQYESFSEEEYKDYCRKKIESLNQRLFFLSEQEKEFNNEK